MLHKILKFLSWFVSLLGNSCKSPLTCDQTVFGNKLCDESWELDSLGASSAGTEGVTTSSFVELYHKNVYLIGCLLNNQSCN